MGFFSWNCKGCNHPALSHMACTVELNDWMTQCVVLKENGTRIIGEYDGYGRVNGYDIYEDGEPCLWHLACWRMAGKPEYSQPSKSARDQGWFFYDGEHDMLDPEKTKDLSENDKLYFLKMLQEKRDDRKLAFEKEMFDLEVYDND